DKPQLRELLEKVLPAKKELADVEITQTFSELGEINLCLNAREIDNLNGEKLILLSMEDVTAKRKVEKGLAEVERLLSESKERLKFAVESAGLGTWDYNPKTKELICDKRCKEIFNFPTAGNIDITSFFEMIHPDDRERVETSICETLKDVNSGQFNIDYRTVAINEKIKWLKAKGSAYFNEQGEAVRFIGTLLDITAQKLLDEATKELLKKKDEFISIASHELKTPITSLKASLQILDKLKDNPTSVMLPKLIAVANKSMEKISSLVEDLLNVSKLNQGQLHLHKTHFVISDVIDGCCHHVRAEGIFTIKTEGDKTLEVYADAGRIEQILVNFVNNAIKYAPQSKEILINIEKAGKMVRVSVNDKGPGIAPDMIPHLFDRYYRVDKSGTQYSGLGLGLYICAEIIKKLGGQIGVDSEINKGSSFWFTLPLS
ncbi:cell wall metabolism sensor histidine kinase WalK, partial [Mucilaginibacter sp.]|uniref:sensor histidine kinase n=1 Tax=Mucilaginibacter sp. TaxID=1882438 RepID=UPI00262FFB41